MLLEPNSLNASFLGQLIFISPIKVSKPTEISSFRQEIVLNGFSVLGQRFQQV